MVNIDTYEVLDSINISPVMLCTDKDIRYNVKLQEYRKHPLSRRRENVLYLTNYYPFVKTDKFIDLSLKIFGKDIIQEKGGLNWGQRPGREPNQAYIPVPLEVHKENPNFFPNLKEEFTIITDDGKSFLCKMEQDNRKAITICRNNSELGKYFRSRLGVQLGEKVEVSDLYRYGRDYVRIFKINRDLYFMDFSVNF
ncbi:hypothetical protein [Ectobacillus sp. sgz5001026]|uniref:hypothetical protein n=1 Tax=Ectobacillus sp. sgz5001026 TaxID=3242473 RepID=UPI0036D2736D